MKLCPMASSADVPHCTRTSFLMSNYHRWTGHISLVLLSNTGRRYLPYCSVLSKVSMLIYMKTPGKLKRFWVSHLTHLQILNIFGKSTGDIDRENRGGKQALGKMFFPFTSLPEMIWRLPSTPNRSAQSQQSKPTQTCLSPKPFVSSPGQL